MESESRYALVGAFTISILAAAALFTLWLGQVSFNQKYAEYDVIFEGPVRGLSKSSEVRFNGIKVGEVTNLGLDRADPNHIVVAHIKVFAETPIKEDSYAQLEPQGITGLSYIQIYGGSAQSPPLRKKPGELYPRIPSHKAQLEGLFSGGADLLLSANSALVRINTLLSTKNITAVSGIIADVHTLTQRLAAEETLFADLDESLRATRKAVDDAAAAAQAIAVLASNGNAMLDKDAGPMIQSFTDAAGQIRQASLKINALLDNISEPVSTFSDEGLSELTLTLSELRSLIQVLQRTVEDFDRNPGAFMSGKPVKQIEVPR